jgi:hypothetical protein
MVNTGEPLINVVNRNKPKTLRGLRQKARGPAQEFSPLLAQTAAPPADRRDLQPPTVRTRNVVSPSPSLGVSTPQGALTERRVQDEGGSEGRPVMGRIGGAPTWQQTPHASAQTSLESLLTREFDQPAEEAGR